MSRGFTAKATLVSVIYWMVDSLIHKLAFAEEAFEFIPSDVNELGMRLIIVALLIAFGGYADYHTKALLKKEREKQSVVKVTVRATQHIVNNLLNQMQYFKFKAEELQAFEEQTLELYEQSIAEAEALTRSLGSIDDLTEENIKQTVFSK